MTDQLNFLPGYWRHEVSGTLRPVIEKYLREPKRLTLREVAHLRLYLVQWIEATAWDDNPYLDTEGTRSLAALRQRASAIRSLADVERWLHDAVDLGIDPL